MALPAVHGSLLSAGKTLMKRLLLFIPTLILAVSSYAQASSEEALYLALATAGEGSVTALNAVVAKPDSVSAVILYTASSVALREGHLEDAGFLYYVARFRAQFDKELFPPTGTGGNSPMVLFGALQQQLGQVVSPLLMAEPKA